MFHRNRCWSVTPVETAEALATKLTGYTWTCCSGFSYGGLLYLNDSTCEDGAQEYAVVRKEEQGYIQIESITFGWCKKDEALKFINDLTAQDASADVIHNPVTPNLSHPREQFSCHLCA